MSADSLSLLFVCTANIARSPYAELRARMLFQDAPITVTSAGVPGFPGRPMDAEMAAQLRLRNGDPSGHVSRRLTAEILDDADIVLAVTFDHQMRILREWPAAAGRTLGLRQFADAVRRIGDDWDGGLDGSAVVNQVTSVAQLNSMAFDLDDPHGRGRRIAKRTAEDIDDCLRSIVEGLRRAGARRTLAD